MQNQRLQAVRADYDSMTLFYDMKEIEERGGGVKGYRSENQNHRVTKCPDRLETHISRDSVVTLNKTPHSKALRNRLIHSKRTLGG